MGADPEKHCGNGGPMRSLLLVFVTVALGLSTSLHAQDCSRTSAYAEDDLADVTALFYDTAAAAERGPAIQLLARTDAPSVVRDASACQVVLSHALAYLRQHDPLWVAVGEGDYEATIYRVGPYYAVEVQPEDAAGTETNALSVIRHGRNGVLLIYRASDFALLRVLA